MPSTSLLITLSPQTRSPLLVSHVLHYTLPRLNLDNNNHICHPPALFPSPPTLDGCRQVGRRASPALCTARTYMAHTAQHRAWEEDSETAYCTAWGYGMQVGCMVLLALYSATHTAACPFLTEQRCHARHLHLLHLLLLLQGQEMLQVLFATELRTSLPHSLHCPAAPGWSQMVLPLHPHHHNPSTHSTAQLHQDAPKLVLLEGVHGHHTIGPGCGAQVGGCHCGAACMRCVKCMAICVIYMQFV